MSSRRMVSRRLFLKWGVSVGLSTGGALLLGVNVIARDKARVESALNNSSKIINGDAPLPPDADEFAPNAFIRIDRQGTVTLVMPKVEMGQGVYTALPMLIAEELEVPLDHIRLEHAQPDASLYADTLLGSQMTGGSTSIRWAWQSLRHAGAVGRTLLVHAAAQRWKVDAASCTAEQGQVLHAATGRQLSYGDLAGAAAKISLPEEVLNGVALKKSEKFRLIGTAIKRLDSPEKIDGTAIFGIDARLPGMVYAIIVACPVIGGKLKSVDDKVALRTPGVLQTVKLDNAVAVIGSNTWAARRGAMALAIEWNEGANHGLTTAILFDDLAKASKGMGAIARKDGDFNSAYASAYKNIDQVYRQPLLAHATMEPMNCTVHVRSDACEIWIGTQVPTRVVDAAVAITGLPAQKIIVHNFLIGGGFGRRLETDGAAQAIRIARHLDVPVKVMWTREEDIQQDIYRPCYYDHIMAGLDYKGKPVAWSHRIVGSSIIARFFPPAFKNGLDIDAIEVAASIPYDIPNQTVDYIRAEPRGVPTGFWRGVGPCRSTFVVESFIDELAVIANRDPVTYRRELLGKSPRALNVMNVAVQAANWNRVLPPGQGRGISVMNAFGSFLCMIVEVTVENSEVRVNRIICAVDCGQVINPDTVKAQIEGGAIFGITAALYSQVTLKDGRVEQSNFNDYRMLRINETPQITTLIVKSDEAPGGIGEPGTAVLAPALTNAIFAATGQRLRQLPVGNQLRPGSSV